MDHAYKPPTTNASEPLSMLVSYSVLIFFVLFLPIPRGYVPGFVLLIMLSGLCLIRQHQKINLASNFLAKLFLLSGLISIGIHLAHADPLSTLDIPSKYILTTIILLALPLLAIKERLIYAGVALGAISSALTSLWQTYTLGYGRSIGYTGIIQYGNVSLALGLISLCGLYFYRSDSKKSKLYYFTLALGTLAGLYASISSGSRGGWVSLPAILIALIYFSNVQRKLLFTLLSFAVVGFSFFIAVQTSANLQARIEHTKSDIALMKAGDLDTSIGARLAMWQTLVDIIPQKPLIGWPKAKFTEEMEKRVDSGVTPDYVQNLANTHNTFLEQLTFEGLLGLLPVLLIFAYLIKHFTSFKNSINRRRKSAALAGLTVTILYLFSSLSQIMLARTNTLVFFLIAISLFYSITIDEKKE